MGTGRPVVVHCLFHTDCAVRALLAAHRGLVRWLLIHLNENAEQKLPNTINLEPAVNSPRM